MRKKTVIMILCHGLLAVLTGLCLAGPALPAATGAEKYYVENEWNYVDISMPADKGIPEDAQGVLGQIGRKRVLRVATDAAQPPRTFRDPDREGGAGYAGADMELARYIADRMGAELKIIQLEPERVLPALLDDQCDLAVSAIGFTPGRGLSYTMSKAYDRMDEIPEIGILIREGSPVETLDDLKGKVIAALSDSLAETVAAREVRNYLEFRRIPVVQSVGVAVEEGRVDAAFVDVKASEHFIEKNPTTVLRLAEGLRFTPDETYLGFRVAARKGETQLISFVNGVIDEVQADGLYETWKQEALERCRELGLTE